MVIRVHRLDSGTSVSKLKQIVQIKESLQEQTLKQLRVQLKAQNAFDSREYVSPTPSPFPGCSEHQSYHVAGQTVHSARRMDQSWEMI